MIIFKTLLKGDITENGIYYHTHCRRNFHSKFNKPQQQLKQNFA